MCLREIESALNELYVVFKWNDVIKSRKVNEGSPFYVTSLIGYDIGKVCKALNVNDVYTWYYLKFESNDKWHQLKNDSERGSDRCILREWLSLSVLRHPL